ADSFGARSECAWAQDDRRARHVDSPGRALARALARRAGADRRAQAWRSGHVDSLHVHELLDSVARELAAEAGLADAADGQGRVGSDERVDEAGACVEAFARDALAAIEIAGEDGRAQSVRRSVRERDRFLFVARADDRGDGAEGLFVERGHAWSHAA